MKTSTYTKCSVILSAMLSPTQPWSDAVSAIYLLSMKDWADEVALRTCEWCASNMEYRPQPVNLRAAAINLFAPIPSAMEVRNEWTRRLNRYCDIKDRERGAHPILLAVVKHLGGDWNELGQMLTDRVDRLMIDAYAAVVIGVQAQVAQSALTAAGRASKTIVGASTGLSNAQPTTPRQIEGGTVQ